MTRRDSGRGRYPRGRGQDNHGNDPPSAHVSLQQGPIRGKCGTLCPANEAAERARTQELSRFERPTSNAPALVPVKKYRRAAAGRAVWDPMELRPAPVLLRTLRHLLTTVLPWPQSGFDGWEKGGSTRTAEFLAVYHFVNDRVRSVRQDFTVQRIEDASLVTALQQIARFYLLAGLRSVQLLESAKSQQDWSDKLNDEQLVSALSQLQGLYNMHEVEGLNIEDTPELNDAGEFVAYDLLLHADKPQAVAWMLLKLSSRLRQLPAVQRAARAFVALQTDDFHAFFVEFYNMNMLERAASLRHFLKIWTRSLRMINKGFGKQDRFPLEELARWMGLANPQSEGDGGELAEKLCDALNIQTQRSSLPAHTRMGTTDVADSWEADGISDQLASLTVTNPFSIGCVQLKLKPLYDEIDPDTVRHLLHHVALRIEGDFAQKASTIELVMGVVNSLQDEWL